MIDDNFGIKLEIFEGFNFSEPDPNNEQKAIDLIESYDPFTIACLNAIAKTTKSSALALCLINGHISLEDALKAARLDEDF